MSHTLLIEKCIYFIIFTVNTGIQGVPNYVCSLNTEMFYIEYLAPEYLPPGWFHVLFSTTTASIPSQYKDD